MAEYCQITKSTFTDDKEEQEMKKYINEDTNNQIHNHNEKVS